jgi:hypothetical protein
VTTRHGLRHGLPPELSGGAEALQRLAGPSSGGPFFWAIGRLRSAACDRAPAIGHRPPAIGHRPPASGTRRSAACDRAPGDRAPGTRRSALGTGLPAPGSGRSAPGDRHRAIGTGRSAPGSRLRAIGTGHRAGRSGTRKKAPGPAAIGSRRPEPIARIFHLKSGPACPAHGGLGHVSLKHSSQKINIVNYLIFVVKSAYKVV